MDNELTACYGDKQDDSRDEEIYTTLVQKNGIVEIDGKKYRSATLYGWPGQEVSVTLPNKNVEKCAAVYLNGVFLCFARHIGEIVGGITGNMICAKLEKHDKAVKLLLLHLLQHELPTGKLLDYINCAAVSAKMLGDKVEGWDDITIQHADDLMKRLYGEDDK